MYKLICKIGNWALIITVITLNDQNASNFVTIDQLPREERPQISWTHGIT